jgi:hypothetical protein
MNETMEAQPPNEVMGAFAGEQADLVDQPVPTGAVELGDPLADFELLDPNGSATSLYQALGGRVSVLVFYRGDPPEPGPSGCRVAMLTVRMTWLKKTAKRQRKTDQPRKGTQR